MAQLCVMRMLAHMWKFSGVFLFISVPSCSSTLKKRKCRTVEQSWSVLECMTSVLENGSRSMCLACMMNQYCLIDNYGFLCN